MFSRASHPSRHDGSVPSSMRENMNSLRWVWPFRRRNIVTEADLFLLGGDSRCCVETYGCFLALMEFFSSGFTPGLLVFCHCFCHWQCRISGSVWRRFAFRCGQGVCFVVSDDTDVTWDPHKCYGVTSWFKTGYGIQGFQHNLFFYGCHWNDGSDSCLWIAKDEYLLSCYQAVMAVDVS